MSERTKIITVSLNPAIDRAIEVENLVPGEHLLGYEITRTPGGKGVNTSRILAAMEMPCVATGFLGEENRGEFEEAFKNPLIADEFFSLPGRTRENVTLVDRAGNTETHIRDVGLEVDARNLDRLTSKLKLLSKDGAFVLFCGSMPPGVGPDEFASLVDACREAGAHVAVDTSGKPLRAMRGRKLWLLKPNARELAHLMGRELPTLKEQVKAAREVAREVEHVILTRGAEGALLFTRQLELKAQVKVDPQRVQNTVGCGDALLGAFVAGVCQGLDLRRSLARAVACATATACHPATAKFDPQLLAELSEKVLVGALD